MDADTSPSIFVAYNGYSADITATLLANHPGNRRYLVADTAVARETSRSDTRAPARRPVRGRQIVRAPGRQWGWVQWGSG
jgi:hypothetical protein